MLKRWKIETRGQLMSFHDTAALHERYKHEVAEREAALIDSALADKLGPLTEKELDRARSECECTVNMHIKGTEKSIFHRTVFLIGFSERWIMDELVISVQMPDGNNKLFSQDNRAKYDI